MEMIPDIAVLYDRLTKLNDEAYALQDELELLMAEKAPLPPGRVTKGSPLDGYHIAKAEAKVNQIKYGMRDIAGSVSRVRQALWRFNSFLVDRADEGRVPV